MAIYLGDVRQLENSAVRAGDMWLYSADFNVKYSKGPDGSIRLKDNSRLDAELDDLRQISESGGIAVMLAHQGRHEDGDTEHLDYVAPVLGERLGRSIAYFGENDTESAARFVDALKSGDVAIMGNTRFHAGEERNDPALAKRFAGLVHGKGYAAIGGFGKAHRANASNVGILDYLPGYMTRSQTREMHLLEPWAGRKEGTYSVAVIGGVKKEKIIDGLAGLSGSYDSLIPGGIVLNTIYYVQGRKIGASVISDGGEVCDAQVDEVLKSEYASKICVPEEVIAARPVKGGFADRRVFPISDGVPEGYMIVDFILPDSAYKSLERLASEGGRLILAGTPGIYTAGFKAATDAILEYMRRENIRSIALGGDSSSELDFSGMKSTGGGSALSFVANGTTAVYEALKENKKRFPDA